MSALGLHVGQRGTGRCSPRRTCPRLLQQLPEPSASRQVRGAPARAQPQPQRMFQRSEVFLAPMMTVGQPQLRTKPGCVLIHSSRQ